MIPDYFQQLQDDVWGVLTNDAGFTFVPVYRVRTPLERDAEGEAVVGRSNMIEEQIEQALGGMAFKGGKCGIVAIVMLPDVQAVSADSRGPARQFTIMVRIIEDRLFNESETGTGITSARLALHTVQLLQQRNLLGLHGVSVDPTKMLEEINLPDDRKAWEVRVKVSLSPIPLGRVARPLITKDGNDITITCSTPDAVIYYTTDGSWPGPANAASVVYENFINATTLTTLRVVAYAPDLQCSDDVSWGV